MNTTTTQQLAAARVKHALDRIDRFADRHHSDDKLAHDALVIALLKQRAGSEMFRVAELEAVIEGDAVETQSHGDVLQTTVTLAEQITGASVTLVVDYRVIDDEDTDISAPTAMDVEIVAAWAGTQNVQHWLCDGSHHKIRSEVAEQLRRDVEQAVDEGAALQLAEVA